ncbi:3-hydroxyacyl-CoA dehydrogenase NAD-binding domain-containing protein [Nocardia sp. NPDC050717]|uniref:3-hydroxyacyl-CoA dehydrogenase NAD-binding domain-containing protein n=1 Tax=Nocardia sp. NPDC050717 TaxID=3157221 RepID=UPI0033E6FFF8
MQVVHVVIGEVFDDQLDGARDERATDPDTQRRQSGLILRACRLQWRRDDLDEFGDGLVAPAAHARTGADGFEEEHLGGGRHELHEQQQPFDRPGELVQLGVRRRVTGHFGQSGLRDEHLHGVVVELDTMIKTIDQFAAALNPEPGQEGLGPLSGRVLHPVLNGNGAKIRETLDALSAALKVGLDNKDALSTIILELNEPTTMLADNDQSVRDFSDRMTAMSALLAEQAPGLQATLDQLSQFLSNTSTTFAGHERELAGALTGLTTVTDQLRSTDNSRALTEIVDLLSSRYRRRRRCAAHLRRSSARCRPTAGSSSGLHLPQRDLGGAAEGFAQTGPELAAFAVLVVVVEARAGRSAAPPQFLDHPRQHAGGMLRVDRPALGRVPGLHTGLFDGDGADPFVGAPDAEMLLAGMTVLLKDLGIEAAEKGKDYSRGLLDKAVAKGKMTPERRDEILDRIIPTADYARLEGADLVVGEVQAALQPHGGRFHQRPEELDAGEVGHAPHLARRIDRPHDGLAVNTIEYIYSTDRRE